MAGLPHWYLPAREHRSLSVDRDIDSAQETVELIHQDGGKADAVAADVIDENSLEAAVNHCNNHFGRLDILHKM
ncbi:MAG: hypothetical protein CM1200mP18_06550 [Gammaproteobacteria bacterium]|nr:MAG: hypothetical protein CM1200mP18_06550 [Gammaproteobacteria bacterium]